MYAVATKLSESERTRLESALAAICGQAGLDHAGAVLVRYTMNAVYRINAAGVVIRMTTGPTAASRTERVAHIAATLADRDLPTARLAPGICQPMHAAGWSATVWMLLPQPPGHRFAPVDLAKPLRAIHAANDLHDGLPTWDTVGKSRDRIAQIETMDGPELHYLEEWALDFVGLKLDKIIDWLQRRCNELTSALDSVEWTLPWSAIHGDAHKGNLLLGTDGSAVICDLDSVTCGPPEWDLIPAAHGALRFGDDLSQSKAFADAYGIDVTACPAWETLRQVRELQLLSSVIANLPGRPDVASELAHRLRTSLAGDQVTQWHRYQ
jgi:aminoglycoside phosphotransferase (APT) family kinase protein